MDEDKQKICDLLLPAIQATREGSDVTALRYVYNHCGQMETVTIHYQNGSYEHVYVTGDSGVTMIRDIMRKIDCSSASSAKSTDRWIRTSTRITANGSLNRASSRRTINLKHAR